MGSGLERSNSRESNMTKDPMRESSMQFFAAALGSGTHRDTTNDSMAAFYMSQRNNDIFEKQARELEKRSNNSSEKERDMRNNRGSALGMLKNRRNTATKENRGNEQTLHKGSNIMQSTHILGLIDQFHQENTNFKSDMKSGMRSSHAPNRSFYGGGGYSMSQVAASMSSEMDLSSNNEYGNLTKRPNKLKLSIKRKRNDSRGDSIEKISVDAPSQRNAPTKVK